MANFAALIAPLSISGSRLSDGSPNASGRCWFFQPGTNTPVTVYSDAEASAAVTAPVTLTAGGLVSAADYPDGIFTTQPIRLYIEDSAAAEVSDNVYIPATAGNVGIDNDATTATTLDAWITQAQTSTGGTNFNYLESAGATARTTKAKFAEIWISAKDFGAVGDGIAVDSTAIQAAINRVKALGGGVVYFPPGTYLVDQAFALASANSVSYIGAGLGVTTISSTHASANIFTFTSCQALTIAGLNLVSTGSSGAAMALASCTDVTIRNVGADGLLASGDNRYAISASACNRVNIDSCLLYARGGDAAARGILLTSTTAVTMRGTVVSSGAAGSAMELTGGTSTILSENCFYVTPIVFAAALTGSKFVFVGGTYDGTTPFSISTATLRDLRTIGTGVDGYTENVTSGGTFTPNLALGRHFRMRVTTTGAAITIALPTPPPTSTMYGYTIVLDVFNDAGGPISNAYVTTGYHLTTAPNQTDTNHNVYTLLWDPDAGVWRQLSLSVTT